MTKRSVLVASAALFLGFACCLGPVRAGPIDPPAGAVAPTGKTISEASPGTPIIPPTTGNAQGTMYRITASGSYYLTANFDVLAGTAGIEIAASNVTLDLRGFRVQGQATSGDLIRITQLVTDVEIRNGSLATSAGNGIAGLLLNRNGRIRDISVRDCALTGILVGAGSMVTACQVNGCQVGFNIDTGSKISDCIARQGGTGFNLSTSVQADRCSATNNSGVGFQVANGCGLQECNASSNAGGGFLLTNNSIMTKCVARSNTGVGISAERGCVIRENISSANTGDGIRVSRANYVVNNSAQLNGPTAGVAGLRCTGNANRIEGNMLNDNPIGLKMESNPNVYLRNICAANATNYDITPSNFGRVAVPAPAPAFTGNTGGANPATDPDVNLAY